MAEEKQDALMVYGQKGIEIRTISDLQNLSNILAKSQMVPAAYQNKPFDIFVAIQAGRELGLSPLQSLNGIAMIKGRPTVFGCVFQALVVGHPICESYREWFEGEGDEFKACVETKRVGRNEKVMSPFSVGDAKVAGLWGVNTWKGYPKDMLLWRARHRNFTANFPDRLCGYTMYEVAMDLDPVQLAREVKSIPMDELTIKPCATNDEIPMTFLKKGE